jgi:hypothetical protein
LNSLVKKKKKPTEPVAPASNGAEASSSGEREGKGKRKAEEIGKVQGEEKKAKLAEEETK